MTWRWALRAILNRTNVFEAILGAVSSRVVATAVREATDERAPEAHGGAAVWGTRGGGTVDVLGYLP